MSEPLVRYVGNRNAAFSDTITSGGTAQNINGKTLTFKMRPVASSTLKVNAAATNLDDNTTANRGKWQYNPAAADVDTAGFFLFWIEVAGSGLTQDVPEFLVQFVPHSPLTNAYIEVEEFKNTLTLLGTTFANQDAEAAVLAACRAIDKHCGRRFWADTGTTNVRHYTALSKTVCVIDDLVTLTSLKTDPGGDTVFEETWVNNTDFVLQPLNASADSQPWTRIEVHPGGNYTFPTLYPRTVEVTGKFGWNAVPAEVKQATSIVAHTLLKRSREAPFGVVGVGLDSAAVRIPQTDPQVRTLLAPFVRHQVIA